MRIAGYGETLHPLAFTWDYALAAIMCDIKLDILGTVHGSAFRGDATTCLNKNLGSLGSSFGVIFRMYFSFGFRFGLCRLSNKEKGS